jgi:hypothetical protein
MNASLGDAGAEIDGFDASYLDHDLSALRCRCDGCLHTFGHLGPN